MAAHQKHRISTRLCLCALLKELDLTLSTIHCIFSDSKATQVLCCVCMQPPVSISCLFTQHRHIHTRTSHIHTSAAFFLQKPARDPYREEHLTINNNWSISKMAAVSQIASLPALSRALGCSVGEGEVHLWRYSVNQIWIEKCSNGENKVYFIWFDLI